MGGTLALLAQDTQHFISFPNIGIRLNNMRSYFNIGNLEIHWYGVIICLGMVLCMILGLRRTKSYGIKNDDLLDYILFAIPVSIICARIYYVAFNFGEYKDNPSEIFKIWNGGIAIYGAVIGIVLVALVATKIKKRSFLHILDFALPYVMLGQAIGRWGNFVNQEAYGSATSSKYFLGMTGDIIAGEAGANVLVHPTFLYESAWCLLGFVFLVIYRKKLQKNIGEITALYMIVYGVERAVVEGLRTDSLMIGGVIRVSQWLSVILVVVGIALFIDSRRRGKPLADAIRAFNVETGVLTEEQAEEEKEEEKSSAEERTSLSDVAELLADQEQSGDEDNPEEAVTKDGEEERN